MPPDKTRVQKQSWSQRSKQFATLLLLATVLICIITATANAAGATGSSPAANATTSTQSSVGATTHPIEYHIGCPPSMVNDGSLDYFKSHGFTAVHMVVPDKGTYKTELNKIKSLGMKPIIDVEVPIWNGGQLQGTPITSFGAYFQSLKNAGWEYVSSEGGRAGDLTYMAQFFKGYVNYNCDQCGLWKDMYKHPFTVMNSWESYYTSEWPYIQQGAKVAASLGKQNGILAGMWGTVEYNPILINSLNGGSPSYKSMLDWSYANGIGFNHFQVWCGLNSQGLSRYKALGFEGVVSNLQKYYPATGSASGKSTQLILSPSTTTPAVGQSVTFTATLKSGTTPLSKSITIYHYLNGVRYTDTTKTTNANGKVTLAQSFGSVGKRTYYATFPGDSSYAAKTSSVVTINVGSSAQPTQLSLSPSTANPTVGQSVTFTATLKSGSTAVSSKSVTIYHYLNGVRYTDTTKATNANGKVTLAQSFGSVGKRTYYATFPGDSSYAAKTSSVVTINVGSTQIVLIPSTTAPSVGQSVTFTATLKSGTTPLSSKSVTIYHYLNGVRYTDTTKPTNAYGQITLIQRFGSAGPRTYYATFAGDNTYQTSTSSVVTMNVH